MPFHAGQIIGAYSLLKPLGSGGMGEVWLAERIHSDFQQQVAIKLIQAFRQTPSGMRRFMRERQILAGLQHPGITRLLDGGRTVEGQPYYVMEYVVGRPLTEYCRANKNPLVKRLELFQKACAAVQYAHQKLIVHSDLKPEHILIDNEENVKLLDFGLARLQQKDTNATVVKPMFTLAYASPEQISGEQLTTSTDVYSLGVILYELLTGMRPYELENKTSLQALKVVAETVPRKPSFYDNRLSDDLDIICLKALEKEPEERYASAEALSEDLRRYNNGLAVTAKPKSSGYLLRKFLQRNALTASLFALTVLTISIVIAFYTLELRREQQQAVAQLQRAESLNNFFQGLFEYKDRRGKLTHEISVKELVDIGARRIEAELLDQPGEQALLMRTIGRVYYRLGFRDLEMEFQQKGMRLAEKAFDGSSLEFIESRRAVAEAMSHSEKNAEAESLLTLALQVAGDKSRQDYRVQQHSAIVNDLGVMKRRLGKDSEAINLMDMALRMGQQENDMVQILTSLNHLAILYRRTDKLTDAERIYAELLPLVRQRFGDDHPNTASTLGSAGRLFLQMDNPGKAEDYLTESLQIREKIYGDSHPKLRSVLNALADMHSANGELETALRLRRRAVEISRQFYGESHRYVLSILKDIAEDQKKLGRPEEAQNTLGMLDSLRAVNGER